MRPRPANAALLFGSVGMLALGLAPILAPDDGFERELVVGVALEFFLAMLALSLASLAGPGIGARLGLGRSVIPWRVLTALVAGTLMLSFALNGLYDLSGFGHDSALAQFETNLEGRRGWTALAAVFSFALAPGVAEELLCRGLIQRGLQRRFGAVTSIAVAAAIFGSLHLEPIYMALASVLGAYLGVITLLGGSIRPAIVCHSVNNLVAVLAAASGWEFDLGTAANATLSAITLALAGAVLWLVWRHLGGAPAPPPFEPDTENLLVSLQPGPGLDDA